MNRFTMAAAGSLVAVLAWAGAASAQNQMNSFGGYIYAPPSNMTPGGYVVGPSLPGAGGTYSYVQQNPGAGMGMSPNAYYSMNYFTRTPMVPGDPYAYPNPAVRYSSGYATPTVGVQPASTTGYVTTPSTGYVTTPGTSPVYSSANATYYNNRRSGPLRRIFGRR